MWTLTIRGLLAHRVRLVLSAVAVALGVAFVSGSLVLTGTLDATYDDVFGGARAGTDLVVRLAGPASPEGAGERFPEAVRDRVDGVAGVDRADGVVVGRARVLDAGGTPISAGVAPTLAVSWSQAGRDGPLRIVGRGRPPRTVSEVALDVRTAERAGVGVGDRVRIAAAGPAAGYRVTALVDLAGVTDLGGVTVSAFTLDGAQRVVGAPGELDEVAVRLDPGADRDRTRHRVEEVLGGGYDVWTAERAARAAGTRLRDLLALLRAVLAAFGVLGMAVAVLLVGQTFAVLGAQRRREVALVRVAGATRGQVVGLVLAEGLVVGVVAGAVGVGLGVAGAAGALIGLRAGGVPAPDGGLRISAAPLVLAFGVGVVAAAAAALPAALRSARRPVVEALGDERVPPGRRGRAPVAAAGALVVGAVVAAGLGVRGAHLTEGARLVRIGTAAVASLGAALLLLEPIFRWLGGRRTRARSAVVRRLARSELARSSRRSAATAGALVVVVALTVALSTFAASARASVATTLDAGLRAQVVVRDPRFTGFSGSAAGIAESVPGVRAVNPLQFRRLRVDGTVRTAASVRGSDLAATVDLGRATGRTAALGPGRVLLSTAAADDLGVAVGDRVSVQMSRVTRSLEVVGTFTRDDFSGAYVTPVLVDRADYTDGFGPDEPDTLVLVRTDPDVARVLRALRERLARPFPDVDVQDRVAYRADRTASADRVLGAALVLVVLSVVLAVLGVANATALSVLGRTRQFGLLRAVGATTHQVRALVRSEALRVTVVGTAVGTVVGTGWGLAFASALSDRGVSVLTVPVARVAFVAAVVVGAGLAATVVPGRRAARSAVLAAVATD